MRAACCGRRLAFHVEQGTPPTLAFLDKAIATAKRRDLFRERPPPRPGGSLSFCSNDYLALANRAAEPAACGAGASRLLDGDRAIHAQLEMEAATLVAQPGSLVYTSGYAANVGLLSALARAPRISWSATFSIMHRSLTARAYRVPESPSCLIWIRSRWRGSSAGAVLDAPSSSRSLLQHGCRFSRSRGSAPHLR